LSLKGRALTRLQAAIVAVVVVVVVVAAVAYYYTTLPAPSPAPTPTPAPSPAPSPAPAPTPTPPPPIKIGLILPLTGASAKLGKEVLDGALLALEEINEAGGILGRKVQLVIEDDEGNPDKCLSAAKKLIEADKVDLLAGVLHSGNVVAISEYVASVGIPYISPISSGCTLVYLQDPKKFRNFFTIHPYYDDVAKLGLKFLTDVVKAKSYVYIGEALTFSVRTGDFLKIFAADRGIRCLDQIIMPVAAKDFTEAIIKAKELKPDAVVINVFSGAEITLARQLYENKFPVPYFGIMSTLSHWEAAELLREASDYLCFGTWSWNVSITEKTVPFFNKFYKKYGYRASGLEGPAGYDMMYFIKAAVERAGTLDWNAVIKAYEETETVGVRGKTKIDPTKHNAVYWAPGYINGVIAQWKGGWPYVLWPPELAEKSLEKAPWMA